MENEKVIVLKGATAVLRHNGGAPKYEHDMFDTEVPTGGRIRGLSRRFPKEHRSYTNMLARCKEAHRPVHPAFKTFATFMKVVGPRPAPDATLDRIDNDKPYSPENVRWACKRTQANNRSSTRYLKLGDRLLPLTEWARVVRTNPETIRMRLERGWSDEEAIIGERLARAEAPDEPAKPDNYIDRVALQGRAEGRFPKEEPLYFSCFRAAVLVMDTCKGVAEQHGWELPKDWQARADKALFVIRELLPALQAVPTGRDLARRGSCFDVA